MPRSHATASRRMPHEAAAYRLKVTLRGSSPEIWRRVVVGAHSTLARLHDVIQLAMGWENAHLHCFTIGGRRYGTPSPDDWTPVLDERKVKLVQVAPGRSRSFAYEYDFGDSWLHDVIVEEALRDADPATLPTCLEGGRACPPEDSGGVPAYEEKLAILARPRHPEHREIAEWLGDFDPDAFNLEAVNERLAGLRRGR